MQNKILIILKTKILFLVLLEISFCIWAPNQIFASSVDSLHPDIKRGLDTEMRGNLESFISQDKKSIIRRAADTSILAGEDERREAESFGSEYDQKEPKGLGDKGGSNLLNQHDFGKEMFDGESHKAKLSYDDPVFAKHKGLIKQQNLSKECEELLGRGGNTGEVAGDTDLPEFVETTRKEKVPGFKFDYKPCEELKNKYNCSKKLKVKCKKFGSKGIKLKNIYNSDGTSIRHNGKNINIWNSQNKWFSHSIYFDIDENTEIVEFYFDRIKSNNALKIYFNKELIFNGPNGSSWFGSAIFGTNHNTHIGKEKKWSVKKESNHIKMESNSFGSFKSDLTLKVSAKTCDEWEESWEEECKHQK